MSTVAAIIVLFLSSLFVARLVAVPELKNFALRIHVISFSALFLTIAIVNFWIPFSNGGDDTDYFYTVDIAQNWSEVLSPSIFSRYYAQPGFAILLNAMNLAFQPDLLAFKALNLVFFLLIVHLWMRVVAEIENVSLARRYAYFCVLLTPLWFYFFFLLKDLLIALLLSLFVLGAVKAWKTPSAWSPWLLQILAVLALLPLRAPLAGQALAVIVIVAVSRGLGRGTWKTKVSIVVMTAAGFAAIAWVATNPNFLGGLGVSDEGRVLGSDSMQERAVSMAGGSSINRALFPLLYLMSEVSGLNPDTWRSLDSVWLRGLLAIPWIFAVVPLVPIALLWLVRRSSVAGLPQRRGSHLADLRIVATPWVVVVALVVTSALVAWIVGDTTRWRLADMPAILAIVVGASGAYPKGRFVRIVVLWTLSISVLFLSLALLRSA